MFVHMALCVVKLAIVIRNRFDVLASLLWELDPLWTLHFLFPCALLVSVEIYAKKLRLPGRFLYKIFHLIWHL